ncbi:O-antigen ligase family protein [Brevundimonas sp. R86498]|uniref:O-antigen ligase family protein n=1 Tax=Brevundimonas sp. R86498 TaxID=3093845 RepID=UPI0037CA4D15
MPLVWRLGLALVPILLCLAHLTFGANQPAAATWLTVLLALSLCIALATPLRRGLFDLSPALAPAALFGLVIAVALWSLTPWAPGGAHPLWAWSGQETGSLTIDRGATAIEIIKLLGLAAVFLVGALQGIRRDRATATLEGIVWAGGAWSAISLLMFLAGTQVEQGGRSTGGLLSSNNGATVFGILTVLGLALFLKGWRRASGRGVVDRLTSVAAPVACVALSAVCLLLTASRMGVVATLVSVGLLLLWELVDTRKGRGPVAIAGGLLLALGAVLQAGGNSLLWTRVGELDRDVEVRAEVFSAHWDAFLASPLFGYGLGTFDGINSQIMTSETANSLWIIRATHNVYLQWLEEGGLVGALPMFALIGFILSIALLRGGPGKGRTLQHGLLCANLVVLLHGLTDYALQVPSIAAFWAFLLGLQFAFGQGRGG